MFNEKKLMFNTYVLLVCQRLVILTAHPRNSAHTESQTSSHPDHFPKKPHNPVLHLSKGLSKNLDFCRFNI